MSSLTQPTIALARPALPAYRWTQTAAGQISTQYKIEIWHTLLLTVSSQRFYLLNKLKHAGLNLKVLTVIFQATVVSRVSYALPAWYDHLLLADIWS